MGRHKVIIDRLIIILHCCETWTLVWVTDDDLLMIGICPSNIHVMYIPDKV